jgi:hypothetical protein
MKSSLQDSKRYAERIIGLVDKLFPPPPPKKEEKEVLVLVETDDASAKKCEKTEDGNKPTRASSCQPFTE